MILFHLLDGTCRFNELRRLFPGAAQRTLTNQLRKLETDGLTVCKVHAEVAPKVEYSISGIVGSLSPILADFKHWFDDNMIRFDTTKHVAS